VEFTCDLGSGFAVGKDDCPLFVTSNRCIPVTDTERKSSCVSCVGDNTVVLFIVPYG